MIPKKSLFSIAMMLFVSSATLNAEPIACLQETQIKDEGSLSRLCFTGNAEELIPACENIAHSDEFMTVTTEVLETCPAEAVGTCSFSINGKSQISQYYDLSDQENREAANFL